MASSPASPPTPASLTAPRAPSSPEQTQGSYVASGRHTCEPLLPSPEIERACSFELGPCCSNDTNAIEEIVHIWGSNADPDPVWSGDARQLDPALRRSIDALGAAAAERWRLYAALTDVEREHAIELEDSGALPRDTVSEGVRQYLDSVRRSAAHYDALRAPEVAKIERAIDALGVVLGW